MLDCNFKGSFDEIKTSFPCPTSREDVLIILDRCHTLKLARNSLAHLESIVYVSKQDNKVVISRGSAQIQQQEGLNLAKKISKHSMRFEKRKRMHVWQHIL